MPPIAILLRRDTGDSHSSPSAEVGNIIAAAEYYKPIDTPPYKTKLPLVASLLTGFGVAFIVMGTFVLGFAYSKQIVRKLRR
ncbi:hypothetical protein TWF696_003368 [Orbilia brochopaga]|uniref:Uncharacterized protein n=1 Tax=Orbilia brochopaga TaxID=3140254 RepID=A0AAV9TXM9_9PEZI